MIAGVKLRRLEAHSDSRGAFTEIYSDDWGLPIAPRQWSLVHSCAGTLRGMHVHLRHDESLLVVSGRVFVGLYDLRPDSPTQGQSMMLEMASKPAQQLVFPRGLVHGWYFPEDSVHLQAVSEPHSEYGGDDNNGCHYADPELGLQWPATPRFLSERAKGFPSLRELREQLFACPVV